MRIKKLASLTGAVGWAGGAMSLIARSRIEGAFTGFNYGNVYSLDNGRSYQQIAPSFEYRYIFRPEVSVHLEGGQTLLQVEGMSQRIPVVEVVAVESGPIVNDFRGFDGHSEFKFQNGHVWQQAEYKYAYHYAYRPQATIIQGIGGATIKIEGMNETVRVRRVR